MKSKKSYVPLFENIEQKFENKLILVSVRKGLMCMIPVLMLGSAALVIMSFPVPVYQKAMMNIFGQHWLKFMTFIRDGTFNVLALLLVVSISYSYVREFSESEGYYINPVIASCVSVGSFAAIFGISGESFKIEGFGVTGVFLSMLVAVSSSVMYVKLSSVKAFKLKAFTKGANPFFNRSISSIIPAAVTITFFAAINIIFVSLFNVDNLLDFSSEFFVFIFSAIKSPVIRGILFVITVHILWFFGVHGNNVLEPVAQHFFVPAMEKNQLLISSGVNPTEVFTKTFFDTFVFMGGCGTAICLILAIMISGRQKNLLRLSKIAVIPVLFNINELIVFGLPVVLNPIYIIPFVLVPVVLTVISCGAILLSIVPHTLNTVEWTTPVFISGYFSTGSVSGSILQMINIVVGTAVYIPFVRFSTRVSDSLAKRNLARITEVYKKYEEQGKVAVLTERNDSVGSIARFMAANLEHDIENENIEIYYQPQVDRNGNIVGAEALLRWQKSGDEYVYPPLVIALAEETGIIHKLGYKTLEIVCRDIKKMENNFIDNVTISVNAVPAQLEDEMLVERAAKILGEYNVSADRIAVELTESAALSSGKKFMEQIKRITDSGIKLAMDDFGMGHTSLLYLKEYKFDLIKIDGSLVRDIEFSNNCREIVSSILYLSVMLDFKVMAEFVENSAQRDILKELGCHLFQGHLFSEAVTIEELIKYICNERK